MSDEPRQFVDSNVLVYANDRSAAAKRCRAAALVAQLATSRLGAVSVQILQEFFVTATRKLPQPLPVADAAAIIADLGTWHVHSPQASDVLRAVELQQRFSLSFWDAMILHSASALRCQILWSEDLAHGRRYDGVEVRNPFAPAVRAPLEGVEESSG
ncbi:MAG: PIN domain-containing protein [Candidatus Dormibacteraceae bacterium]